jgi:predicted metalloprotease with PDZ domain
MKKSIIALALVAFLWNSNSANAQKKNTPKEDIKVGIDLIDVKDDKVKVTVKSPKFTIDKITYSIPKIVPGTYSEDNYGKYIDDFKAFDTKGTALAVTKTDDNTWSISNAKSLASISYLVNDTFRY